MFNIYSLVLALFPAQDLDPDSDLVNSIVDPEHKWRLESQL